MLARKKLYRLNDNRGLYLEGQTLRGECLAVPTLNSKVGMYALDGYPEVPLSQARELCKIANRSHTLGLMVDYGLPPR